MQFTLSTFGRNFTKEHKCALESIQCAVAREDKFQSRTYSTD